MEKLLSPGLALELARKGNFKALEAGHISEHFTWGEVFYNCSDQEIIEAPVTVFSNAITQAALMEKVRALFGKPVIVHSWYRDKEHNRRVGGAPKSLHLLGKATDFHLLGFESVEGNRAIQERLDTQPFMKKAGLEFTGGGWTHVDSRGYLARFGRK